MPRLLAGAIAALALLAAPGATQAKTKGVFWQQNAAVPSRIFDHIGFIPINGIQRPEDPPQTVQAGRTTYKVAWINALYGRRTTRFALKELHRRAKYPPVGEGAFTDAPLKGRWKRRFDVLADLARDADVLVVARQNPVCESGLTRAQARGIARGEIEDWSTVGAPGLGAIKRRLIGTEGFAQPRFGAQAKPGRGVVRADGGVSEIAAGDPSVAAITAWSRVRGNSAVCAVPIDGVAPTAQAVFRREYEPAYPIQYVMHVKRRKDREGRAMVKAYVAFLKSAKAAELFRATGLLLVADGEPAAGGGPAVGGGESPFGPPETDYAGRPITTTRDDDGAAAVLSGKRLQSGSERLVFEGDGTFRQLTLDADGSCAVRSVATWAVLDGYAYSASSGGGWIVRARAIFDGYEQLLTVDLPATEPGTAYVDGRTYADDPALPADC